MNDLFVFDIYVLFEFERDKELFSVFIELFSNVLLGIFSLFKYELDTENKLSDTRLSFNAIPFASLS
jgi:hypothetical protein